MREFIAKEVKTEVFMALVNIVKERYEKDVCLTFNGNHMKGDLVITFDLMCKASTRVSFLKEFETLL